MSNAIEEFKRLHIPGDPLILFNIWDTGSAKAVAAAGAKALATGSYGVAEAQGFADGETLPLHAALTNLERIVAACNVPVSLDLESGYGENPEQVEESVLAARNAGAAGINLEDRMPNIDALTDVTAQTARIAAAARSGLFINARCDLFRGQPAEAHGEKLTLLAIERAKAYADAGANGLFVPFTSNRDCISAICEGSPIPVNIIWKSAANGGFSSPDELAELGVARISHGHQPWAAAMDWLRIQAERVLGGGIPEYDTH